MKEHKQVDTSANAKMDKGEPGLPVKIPLSIIRWILYSFAFMLLTVPFVSGSEHDGAKAACGGMILGWFGSLLNAIANKKEIKQ
jgi:hypothetical protein